MSSTPRSPPHWRHVLVSVAALAVATAVTLVLWERVFQRVPFALYFAAVAVAAWRSGWLAGIGVGLAGVLAVCVHQHFAPDLLVPAAVLLGVSAVISLLAASRERADRSRRQSESRHAAILDAALDAIVGMDHAGRVIEWNPAAERTFGYARAEALGREMAELVIPPQYRGAHRAGLAKYLATGEGPVIGKRFEITGVRKGGGEFPVELAVTRVPPPGPPLFTGHLRDISERKQVEAALRESEERFRFLSELGELTRDMLDPEQVMAAAARKLGEHLRASRCAYAEVEPDEEQFAIRHDYTDGCPTTVGTYRLSLFGPRAAADQREGRTLVIGDVDGELAPADGADTFNAIGVKAIVCCPLVKAGRLAAMMAVHQAAPRAWTPDEVRLVEAVVERSWAYIERARAGRALRQSEAEFRLLADAMPQIVWTAGPNGALDYYNRRWFEYVDLPADAAAEAEWARHIHPDDLPRAYEAWSSCLRSGGPYAIEFRVRRADGAYRWFLARALPVRDAGGDILKWYGTCTDVEDQRQLMAQREQLLDSERAARAEAERASRMKDEFLATLSHELRTPLNAILGWAQILTGGGRDDDDLAEGLRTIERNARAQTQIIGDLLDMSRIVSGKVRLDVQRVDLAAVVRASVDTVRPAADAKGVRLHVVLDPLAGPVSGDPGRLQQVFWNLLSNAVKFTPRGGRVQVLLERVNSHLEVSVTDTGEGISPEFLPYAFDRFRQSDATTTRRHGGLGLGLAIVKQLVELHGGGVRAKSPGEGRGATFAVSLPLTAVHAEPEPSPDRRHPSAAGEPVAADPCAEIAGLKVLVVDDEPDARALVKRLLEDCKAVVIVAASAAEALERVRADRPDVLVSDIGMPGEDGYALIRQVRALGTDRGGDTPAVALTAYARAEDRVRVVMAGFQHHVAKPVEPAELIAMIASLSKRPR